MLTLILGGVRSGKSGYAEALASQHPGEKFYYATALPFDDEMAKRIQRHQVDRGDRFTTIEVPFYDGFVHQHNSNDLVLFECLTVLVANLHYRDQELSPSRILSNLVDLENRLSHLIIVSNHLFSEVYDTYSPETIYYMENLAKLHKELAKRADQVIEIRYGIPIVHKGEKL